MGAGQEHWAKRICAGCAALALLLALNVASCVAHGESNAEKTDGSAFSGQQATEARGSEGVDSGTRVPDTTDGQGSAPTEETGANGGDAGSASSEATAAGMFGSDADRLDTRGLPQGGADALARAVASWASDTGHAGQARILSVEDYGSSVDAEVAVGYSPVRLTWNGKKWNLGSSTEHADTCIALSDKDALGSAIGKDAAEAVASAWDAYADTQGWDANSRSARADVSAMRAVGDALQVTGNYAGAAYPVILDPSTGRASVAQAQ